MAKRLITADFVKERNKAMLSLNEKKIKRYCKKYGVAIPDAWLAQHGFKTTIYGGQAPQREDV